MPDPASVMTKRSSKGGQAARSVLLLMAFAVTGMSVVESPQELEGGRVTGLLPSRLEDAQVFVVPFGPSAEGSRPLVARPDAGAAFRFDVRDVTRPFLVVAATKREYSVRGPFAPRRPLGKLRFDTVSTATPIRILGPSGEPVAGATVRVVSLGGATLPGPLQDLLTRRSGPDGRVEIPDLSDVATKISVETKYPLLFFQAFTGEDIRIPSTTSLSGRVVEESGQPVANAGISIDSWSSSYAWSSSATTDERGVYRVPIWDDVPWSTTRTNLTVSARGFAELNEHFHLQELTGQVFALERGNGLSGVLTGPDGRGLSETALVRLFRHEWHDQSDPQQPDVLVSRTTTRKRFSFADLPGGVYSLEIFNHVGVQRVGPWTLAGGESIDAGTIGLLDGSARVGGVILDDDGSPVVGVRVRLKDRSVYYPVDPQWLPETFSDPDGTFSLTGIRGSDFEVEFSRDGFEWQFQPVSSSSAALSVTLRRSGATVVGKVAFPVSSLVYLRCPRCTEIFEYGTLEEDGTFDFSGLTPGHYDVALLSLRKARPERVGFDVGRALETIRVKVGAENPIRVEGRVLVGGEPAENVGVQLLPRDGHAVIVKGARQKFTDSEGRFVSEVDAPGSFEVHLAFPNSYLVAGDVTVEGSSGNQAVSIDLPGTRIRGVVTDAESKAGLAGVRFEAGLVRDGQPPVYEFRGSTDSKGRIDVVGIPAGLYRVDFFDSNYLRASLEATASTSAAAPFRVAMRRGRVVRGTVADASGTPVARARLMLASDGEMAQAAVTDNGGLFEIHGVPPVGSALVAHSGQSGALVELGGENRDVVLNLKLHPMGSIELPIQTGQRTVHLMAGNGVDLTSALRDVLDSGAAEGKIGPVPAGQYLVRVGGRDLTARVPAGASVKATNPDDARNQ